MESELPTDGPGARLGPVRMYFDGSYNWIVQKKTLREPDEGEPYYEWDRQRFYPDPKTALRKANQLLVEMHIGADDAETLLGVFERLEEKVESLAEKMGRPDLENVEPYELPLPHNDNP